MSPDQAAIITAWATVFLAMGTVALVLVTGILIIVGLKQIEEIKDDAKKQRTLEICNRYDSCPILHEATRRLRAGWHSDDILKEPFKFRADVVLLLNYLDSIAIGVAQGLYIEKLARDHMGAVLIRHVKEYFESKLDSAKMEIHRENFESLLSLYEKWKPPSSAPRMHYIDH